MSWSAAKELATKLINSKVEVLVGSEWCIFRVVDMRCIGETQIQHKDEAYKMLLF